MPLRMLTVLFCALVLALTLRSGAEVEGRRGATRVALIVDNSTAATTRCSELITEQLQLVIDRMKSSQQFNIVFTSDSEMVWLFKERLEFAVPQNKRRAERFITTRPSPTGKTDATEALRLIIEQKPNLIFVLYCGEPIDGQRTLDVARKLMQDHPEIKLSTVLLVEDRTTPESKHAIEHAKQLAELGGGDFKLFMAEDLEATRPKPSTRPAQEQTGK
jgi:hypothetical protein